MGFSRKMRFTLIPLFALTILGIALAPLGSGIPPNDSAGDDELRAFLAPRLGALLESATTVEDLVERRSRNILALQAQANRIQTNVEQIDSWLAGHDIPDNATSVVRSYQRGRAQLLRAISQARRSLRSFDFSGIPKMIPVFSEGTDHIRQALAELRGTGRSGSSYTDDPFA